MFLQEAILPKELYLINTFIYLSHDEHLPNASTPGYIRSTDIEQYGVELIEAIGPKDTLVPQSIHT